MQLVGWQHWAGTHCESFVHAVGSPVSVGTGVSVGVGVPVAGGGTGWVHPQKRTNAQAAKEMIRRNGTFFFMVHERFFKDIKASLSIACCYPGFSLLSLQHEYQVSSQSPAILHRRPRTGFPPSFIPETPPPLQKSLPHTPSGTRHTGHKPRSAAPSRFFALRR
jgi:hypothetical protein